MRLHDVSKMASGNGAKILSDKELIQLQTVLLMMLDDLNNICKEYDLGFILIGGTGIGAIRHHGFIPWDDDVDIAMPRADYEKFLRIIRNKFNKKYEISDARDKNNFGKIIPKLRLKGTVYKTVLDVDDENPGIRLDIFIIENTFDNPIMRNIHGIGCLFLGLALSCRRLQFGRKKYRQLSNSLNFKLKSTIGFLFSFASLETWARWTDRWHALCKNNSSKLISIPSDGPHFYKGLTKRENLCKRISVDFAGRKFYVPQDVHNYLTGIYGDYMKIPPKEERIRGIYEKFDLGKYSNILIDKSLN